MTVYGVSGTARVPPGFDGVFTRHELVHAASLADFLILVVPYSPETDNLIDSAVLNAMKPSAFLINVARGGVLDEGALLRALREERIAGAALDVFRQQPLPTDNPFWREDRVIVTPLLGGMSDIYLEQAYPIVQRNLEAFLAGRIDSMVNVVPH
jgi:phosphoglycerate dehydrogenase-like enzyme